MRLETQEGGIHIICDICGDNSLENPDFSPSHMAFKHCFFNEEPSFGSCYDDESKIRQMIVDEESDLSSEWDLLDSVSGIAATEEVEMCDNCFYDLTLPGGENYFSQFERALRESRSKILLKMVEEGRVLPGIRDEDKVVQFQIKMLEEREQEFKTQLEENIKKGHPYDHFLYHLSDIRRQLSELK